jgi:hypothetical protein
MNSDHPVTKGWYDDILKFEEGINPREEKLVADAIEKAEIFEYKAHTD